MAHIDALIDRLAAAIEHTSWRCELGAVDPTDLALAEARLGPLPDEWRAFLSRVRVLENHAGDVAFLTAHDLATDAPGAGRAVDEWRRQDEDAARAYPDTLVEVEAFWKRALPFLCSTVNGDDFLALDRTASPAPVIEACGEGGWSESARVCASSFGGFLGALVDVFEAGPGAFECGWRLSRPMIARLGARDAAYREPLVPMVFVTDFDAASPPRRPTRPLVAARVR